MPAETAGETAPGAKAVPGGAETAALRIGRSLGSRKGRLKGNKDGDSLQLSFYQLEDPLLLEVRNKLEALDINNMTPLDAFDALRMLKKQIGADR